MSKAGEEDIQAIRHQLHNREDHHILCDSRNGRDGCDCYAKRDFEMHQALDRIADAIRAAAQRGAANRQAEIVKLIQEWADHNDIIAFGLIRQIEEQQP